MKTKLTVKQRFSLLSLLPKQSDFTTIKMTRVLKEDLSFDEEEHKKLEFVYNKDGSVSWDSQVAVGHLKEVHIPETIVSELRKTLERLEKSKKLEEQHIDFYEMLIELEKEA